MLLLDLFLKNRRPILLRYAPIILVEIIWWIWALFDAPTRLGRFAEPSPYSDGGYYYYMSLTMTLGSLVAGATAEGGGAVAFPVMTLALGVPPPVARDFSFAIQSFGMTVASITILGLNVPVDVGAILWASIGGAVGLLLGLIFVAPILPPPYAKMFFVSIWIAFAVALYHLNASDEKRKVYSSAVDSDEALMIAQQQGIQPCCENNIIEDGPITSDQVVLDETEAECSKEEEGGTDEDSNSIIIIKAKARYQRIVVLIATGLFGGLCTSIAGSGLDMATFSILTLYYRVDEKIVTPTSVVLMAGNAILGLGFRSVGLGGKYTGDEVRYIWNFVSVCIPIVVVGAPLGATISARVLTRNSIARLLYLLDAIQFIAALVVVQPWSGKKWSSPNNIWLCLFSGLTLLIGSLFFFKVAHWGERKVEGKIKSQTQVI